MMIEKYISKVVFVYLWYPPPPGPGPGALCNPLDRLGTGLD